MSTTATETRTPTATGGTGHLLRAEVLRFRSRRFVRLLLALGLLGLVAGTVVAWTQFAPASPGQLAAAQQQLEQQVERDRAFWEDCLADPPPDLPAGADPQEYCGTEPTVENYSLDWFIDKAPFQVADQLPTGAIAVGVVTAALLFLVGATYVGADWSSRSMVALLFWEPRRMRVVAVKALVVVLAAVLVAAVAQALWVGAGFLLGAARGTTDVPPGFWGDLLGDQGRLVLLGVLAAHIGFSATNLFRDTGATLGAAFLYLVVVENAVRVLRPRWEEWLLTKNVEALSSDGGAVVYLYDDTTGQSREVLVSSLHGALVLGGVCAVLLVLSTWLFQRRDLH
ncbi:ABC transporter permease subunit [Vallicoccus soli]|uniref:ABC transporter permease n=1 Tax=Vallicoccus soli TaxID=2339232 RepID=A0A3A3ZIG5_9ACTN|nr:ABC transporter permease subunit [Vallicoccus soli]RJK95296.1 hypothetical protein D5H78_11540 [Vallicoccus soli]